MIAAATEQEVSSVRLERIKEITMLDLAKVRLDDIVEALEDHSYQTSWWFDPATGETVAYVTDEISGILDEPEGGHPEARGFVHIEPIPSHEGYSDMEDFIARVRDPKARDRLERAIDGRGAFRRFKDALVDLADLREAWFAFHDARMSRRALAWLADEGLIDRNTADRESKKHPDPELPGPVGGVDAFRIAEKAAAALRELYGGRLRKVILFGSWARGDAHPESDIDLLVVLDEVKDRWEELERMNDIMWTLTVEHGVVVTEVPISEEDYHRGEWPLLRNVAVEGREIL